MSAIFEGFGFNPEGLLQTFLSTCSLVAIGYGGLQFLLDAFSIGLMVSVVILGLISVLVHHFKIEKAPEENIQALFGPDPLVPKPAEKCDGDVDAANGNIITGKLANGVGLLRNHLKESNDVKSQPSRIMPPEGSHLYTTPITVVGHRGAGLDAPENTLAAFRLCKIRGCDFVEFDVALTKDNVPVIFHDDDLVRVAGVNKKIADMTWEECKEINLSALHPSGSKFPEERIPTFDAAIDLLMQQKMKFFIDLKDSEPAVVNAVCEAFVRHPDMYRCAIVSSFHIKVVHDIRRRDPKIIGCLAWRPMAEQYKTWSVDHQNLERRHDFFLQDWYAGVMDFFKDRLLHSFFWWFLGLSAILLNKDAVSRRELHTWNQRGIRVFLWTVNEPLEKLHICENMHCSYLTDTLDGDVINSAK